MAHTVSYPVSVQAENKVENIVAAQAASIPWYVWCSALALTATIGGLFWDVSWHLSIGRDTFWTPAHLAIHSGAIIAGISSAYLILQTTFGKSREQRGSSVRVWGFYGPLGAFVSLWGGLTMLTSAPFDNWWHNAFGLDVQILSPPHVVLVLGMFAVGLGGVFLIVAEMNRATQESRAKLNRIFLYAGAMLAILLLMLVWEYTDHTFMHSAIFYRVIGLAAPPVLVGIGRASGNRWGATKVATIYFLLWLLGLWLLPLFPAQAKLGPVYTAITHLIPLRFPLLLFAGALALDYLLEKTAPRNGWLQATVAGTGFFLLMVLVQWPMGSFLISTHAQNWIFGTHYYPYMIGPNRYREFAHAFNPYEKTRAEFWGGMGYALLAAILTTRIGLAWGNWMSRIKR
jgi:hypothetical protein